jgi:hypothetical protein
MDSSESTPTSRLRAGFKACFLIALVVLAFFAGQELAERHSEKRVRDEQEAADAARKQADEARLQLERFRTPIVVPPIDGSQIPAP